MAVNGEISFFRMTNIGQTEATILTDKIEFNEGGIVPDGSSNVINFRPVIRRRNPENPLPHANETDKQDTGYAGNTYTFALYFDEDNDTALGIAKIRDWIIQDQTIDKKFDYGRIGIRNNYRPEFNLTPDDTSGYKIIHFEINQDLGVSTRILGLIVFEHSGDPVRFGT